MRLFSNVHCETLEEIQEVKLKKVWGPLNDWVLLKFLIVTVVHTETPGLVNYHSGFSAPSTGSQGGSDRLRFAILA